MPPVKWKMPQLFELGVSTPGMAPTTAATSRAITPTTTVSWAKPRPSNPCPRETYKAAPLQDHVELTPGGHRRHTLLRTSPGGTTRKAQYISPRKGDASVDDDETILESQADVDQEQYCRRCDALIEVPGQQSEAQRSALARAKRKAGVPAAPQAKRSDRKPWGAAQKERHAEIASFGGSCCCGSCRMCRYGLPY